MEQVNHPKHYNKGNIECIDAMLSSKGLLKTIIFCDTNVFKYNWRQGLKDNELQEVNKQIWYQNKEHDLLTFIFNDAKAKNIYLAIKSLSEELDNQLKDKINEYINV